MCLNGDYFEVDFNNIIIFTAKQHLLAVGDGAGTLHILEIPWSLRQPTPNEVTHYMQSTIALLANGSTFIRYLYNWTVETNEIIVL